MLLLSTPADRERIQAANPSVYVAAVMGGGRCSSPSTSRSTSRGTWSRRTRKAQALELAPSVLGRYLAGGELRDAGHAARLYDSLLPANYHP